MNNFYENLNRINDEVNKYNYKPFLNLIKEKFGSKAVKNIIEMSKIKLKRKILSEQI